MSGVRPHPGQITGSLSCPLPGGGFLEPRVEEDSEGQPACWLGGPGPLAASPVGMEGNDSEGAMSLPSLH